MRKEYKRNLIKFSNYSLCVTLPKAMLNKLSLDKGDEVKITMKRGKLIIEPATDSDSDTPSKDTDTDTDEAWEPMPEISK